MAKNGPPRGGFGIRRPDRINRAHDGTQERDTKNDHSTCWTLQVAAFAQFIGDSKMLALTADRFTKIHLPNQRAPMAASPLEMARIKPYGYSLFNLETMSTLAQIHNLGNFKLPVGRGMKKQPRLSPLTSPIKNPGPNCPKSRTSDQWPMRQSALVFGGLALGYIDCVALWRKLPAA